jgi:hypothetical protein
MPSEDAILQASATMIVGILSLISAMLRDPYLTTVSGALFALASAVAAVFFVVGFLQEQIEDRDKRYGQLEILQAHIRYRHDELRATRYNMMSRMEFQIMRSESESAVVYRTYARQDHPP